MNIDKDQQNQSFTDPLLQRISEESIMLTQEMSDHPDHDAAATLESEGESDLDNEQGGTK